MAKGNKYSKNIRYKVAKARGEQFSVTDAEYIVSIEELEELGDYLDSKELVKKYKEILAERDDGSDMKISDEEMLQEIIHGEERVRARSERERAKEAAKERQQLAPFLTKKVGDDYAIIGVKQVFFFSDAVLPDSVVEIADRAFRGCRIRKLTLSSRLEKIGEQAFYKCGNLKSVTIPKSVKEIGSRAFAFCKSLAEINVEKGSENFSSKEGCLYSADGANFLQCPAGYRGEPTVSDGVTEIAAYAFEGCAIKDVHLPKKIKTIGEYAFTMCNKIMELHIPEGVGYLNAGAFSEMKLLKFIYLPESIIAMRDKIFFKDFNFEAIHFAGDLQQWYTIYKSDDWNKICVDVIDGDDRLSYGLHASNGFMSF